MRDPHMAPGYQDAHARGDQCKHAVRATPRGLCRSMQCTQQEHDTKRQERDALEDAQRTRLQRIHVAELCVERVAQQRRTGEKAEQELRSKRGAERIDHGATLAAGRMRAKTGGEATGSTASTSGAETPTIDSIPEPQKHQSSGATGALVIQRVRPRAA